MSARRAPRRPSAPRRVGAYPTAIRWIAQNDDTDWLDDENGSPSVTLCLVADVFGRSVEEATADLRRAIDFERAEEARAAEAQRKLEQAREYVRGVLAATGSAS